MTERKQKIRLERNRDILRVYGLRFSKPREAILSFFAEKDTHISAEGLYLELKKRGENISLSTVYLNLGVLEKAGIIQGFDGLHGEAVYDSNVSPHYHLICKACGTIVDLPPEAMQGISGVSLRKSAEAFSGWSVEEPKLDFQGTCPACLATK